MGPSTPSLRDMTLTELSYLLRTTALTSETLVKTYLSRIKEVNPEFNAVIETNPEAAGDGRALDDQIPRSSLHGLPILLKDNIPTLDPTSTTCGSLALINARPAAEAAVVTALRSAGAVILGKANMAEWSGFRSTSGCSGWSARGGQGTGVFWKGSKASGSSGGCAAAVSLGLCAAAIGTETCYSIVSPAERSGIVGFKPSRGIISSGGIIHASRRLDTVGVLTRCVEDAVVLMKELVRCSTHHDGKTRLRLYESLDPVVLLTDDLNGVRIGIPWHLSELQNLHRERQSAFKAALDVLQGAGATFAHDIVITGANEYASQSPREKDIIIDTELKDAINSYLTSLQTNPQDINDLTSVIAFTKALAEGGYPHRNVARLECANKTSMTAPFYLAMRKKELFFAGDGGIDGALHRHRCDMLIVPGLIPRLQTFATAAGSPVISVPIGEYGNKTEVIVDTRNGLVDIAPGVPISTFIFGKFGRDSDVIKVGHVLESILKARGGLVPYLVPETDIAEAMSGGCDRIMASNGSLHL